MVTTPKKKTRNTTMAGELTRKNFMKKQVEDKEKPATEVKDAKDAKAVKNEVREMMRASTEATRRMESQVSKINEMIAGSNTALMTGLAEMTSMLRETLKQEKNDAEPATRKNQEDDPGTNQREEERAAAKMKKMWEKIHEQDKTIKLLEEKIISIER